MEQEFQELQENAEKVPIPDLRLFKVRRVKLEALSIEIEEILVEAHTVQYGDAGLLAFYVIVLEPTAQYGVIQRMHRIFREWLDMEEVVVTKSSLVLH